MSTRMIRTLALAVGAGALVLGTAAPAMADDATPNPYRVSIAATAVPLVWSADYAPEAPTTACPAGVTWTAKVPGRQDAITATLPTCSGTKIGVTITVNTKSMKKNAVVKLIGTDSTGKVTEVKTVVVKVTGRTDNPGKGNKP